MVLRQTVHDAVIYGASFWMHQGAVLGLKILQAGRVVGGDALEERQSARPADFDLPHVTYIEKPCRAPDCEVFLDDAGILHRHLPALELHHLAAQRLV
jgi:hypothetical protein